MYRKKMMVIATVFVMGLLGVMIWSSNVVAEHNKKMSGDSEQIAAPSERDIMDGDFGKEHLQNFDPEGENDVENSQRPQADVEPSDNKDLLLDYNNLKPQIVEKRKSAKRVSNNYLEQMTSMKSLILWNENAFPLKVYIKDEANMPAGYADSIKNSFNNWKNSSRGFFSFEYVTNEKEANIIVEAVAAPIAACSHDKGSIHEFKLIGNVLKSAYIKVPKVDCDGKNIEASDFYVVVQHNIGHVLGLQNHSNNPKDVMYPEFTFENINISSADMATLEYLYYFYPNTTNKVYTKMEAKNKQRFAAIKKMTQSEINDYLQQIASKEKTVESASDDSVAQGISYYNKGNYQKALELFNNALNGISQADKAYVYKNIAIVYLNMDNYEEALKNADLAYKIAREPANEYLLAYANYVSGKQNEALLHLEKLMINYPRLRPSYVLAAKIYDEQGNTAKLAEISDKARNTFFDNPPVVYKGQAAPAPEANQEEVTEDTTEDATEDIDSSEEEIQEDVQSE